MLFLTSLKSRRQDRIASVGDRYRALIEKGAGGIDLADKEVTELDRLAGELGLSVADVEADAAAVAERRELLPKAQGIDQAKAAVAAARAELRRYSDESTRLIGELQAERLKGREALARRIGEAEAAAIQATNAADRIRELEKSRWAFFRKSDPASNADADTRKRHIAWTDRDAVGASYAVIRPMSWLAGNPQAGEDPARFDFVKLPGQSDEDFAYLKSIAGPLFAGRGAALLIPRDDRAKLQSVGLTHDHAAFVEDLADAASKGHWTPDRLVYIRPPWISDKDHARHVQAVELAYSTWVAKQQ